MTNNKTTQYYYSLGRRKTAVATVRLYEGSGESTVNGKKLEDFFRSTEEKYDLFSPLRITDNISNFYVSLMIKGGGKSSQREASRLAISRALVLFSSELKPVLKSKGLLTRDPRTVERKKPGLRKARKSPQFSKR